MVHTGIDVGKGSACAGVFNTARTRGDRSPLADPERRGGASGLTRDELASVQALAYGTRDIIGTMRDMGDTVVVGGGLSRHVREYEDATALTRGGDEPVVPGSVMPGAVAGGNVADLLAATCRTVSPRGGDIAAFQDRKYHVIRRMQAARASHTSMMED